MMKRFFPICVLWLCCSCSSLPPIEIRESGSASSGHRTCCDTPFLKGGWQLVHSIAADLPQGRSSVLIGAINIWSGSQTVHCVMMTVEGFVILDAVFGPDLTINKGVPPFDDEQFARGVIDDIRLSVFAPSGARSVAGFGEDQRPVCRYTSNDGRVTDVIGPAGEEWEIRQYRRNGVLNRTVHLVTKPLVVAGKTALLPDQLRISAPGLLGYDLSLTLLGAVPLSAACDPQ
jgi:hypothetical protein